MNNQRTALVIASEPKAAQIGNWLVQLGATPAKIDQIFIPRECVSALRFHSYDMVIAAEKLEDVKGYPWYQALRKLAPNSLIIMFGEADGIPSLFAAEEMDKNLVYLSAGLNEKDVAEYAAAYLEPADQQETATLIPSINDNQYQQCEQLIRGLSESVGAHSIYLADQLGQILAKVGKANENTINEVSSLLGGSFAALVEVGHLLGDENPAMNLIYHQGEQDDLYALGLDMNFSLILLIGHGPYAAKIGTVWYYTHKTATALQSILAELASKPESGIFDQRMDEDLDTRLKSLFGEDENGQITQEQYLTLDEALEQGLVSEDFINDEKDTKQVDTSDLAEKRN
ncbi:MAG: hypothetical protein ACRDFQ_08995 [Anaerolineales bacterium]